MNNSLFLHNANPIHFTFHSAFSQTQRRHVASNKHLSQRYPRIQCFCVEIDMVKNSQGIYAPKSDKVVVLWDLDNKPPRGPPYNAAVSLKTLASRFGEVTDFSAYANRHAFVHLPQWVLHERRERRNLDILERKGVVTPSETYTLREEIRKCRKLTSKPFGVNITLLPVGVQPDFTGIIKCIIDEKIKVVETAGRNPEQVIKTLKQAGIVVIHKCVAIRHALTAAKHGADMISMDGFDCGGHPGEEDVGNWVLAPVAARKLPIPFVVSGGCATGSQLVAALALGAEGINIGTGFMATHEVPVHINIKNALCKASESQTTHIFRTLKNTERVYKNATAMQVREIESKYPGDFSKIAHLVKGENYRKSFHETGDAESSVWSCGQSIGLIDEVKSVKEFIDGIIDEASSIIRTRLPSKL